MVAPDSSNLGEADADGRECGQPCSGTGKGVGEGSWAYGGQLREWECVGCLGWGVGASACPAPSMPAPQ